MLQWDYFIDTKYPVNFLSYFLSCEIRIFTKSLNDEMLTNLTGYDNDKIFKHIVYAQTS